MPSCSRTRRNIIGAGADVNGVRDAADKPDGDSAEKTRPIAASSKLSAGDKKSPAPSAKQARPKSRDFVQLFAFSAADAEGGTGRVEGRPKRKLKAVTRFQPNSSDLDKAHCKIGEGFSCPRCSAVCSYDSRECEACGLACCYEAGIGVVVLKERRVSVDVLKRNNHASQENIARKANASSLPDQGGAESRSTRRKSYPQLKTDGQVPMKRDKVNHQLLKEAKIADSHPAIDEHPHMNIPFQPAEGLPDGWVVRRIPRSNGGRGDQYWYSPREKHKFRSKINVQRFLEMLKETNGDESAAMLLMKKRYRRITRSRASLNELSTANVGTHGEINELEDGNRAVSKILAADNASSTISWTEKIASSETREKSDTDIAVAAMPEQEGDISPLSVRVQLYENELQSGHRNEFVEELNRNISLVFSKGEAQVSLKINVQRFLEMLKETNGDESAAMLLMKKRYRRITRSRASLNELSTANVGTHGEINELEDGNRAVSKILAADNASSTISWTEKIASSETREKSDTDVAVAVAAMPEQEGDISPLSVRVQLYENELQSGHRNEIVEELNRNISAKESGTNDQPEKLMATTDSNHLQDANNKMANLLNEKEASLQKAQTIIAGLRQQVSSATNNVQQLSQEVVELRNLNQATNNRVASLDRSLQTRNSTVQNLERQLQNVKNDVIKLSQQNNAINEQNKSLQSSLTDMASQQEAHAAELKRSIESLETVTKENADLSRQLSELRTKHDSTMSNSAQTDVELGQTKSKLQTIIQEKKDLETKCASFSTERHDLSKLLEAKTAELSASQDKASNYLSNLEELKSKMTRISAQRNTAEKRVKELLSDSKRLNETVAAMQIKKDELVMKLSGVNSNLRTLKSENELKLNKSERACNEKANEIEQLKKQATKRMSQVYELTDQLSTALTEKAELEEKLESATADLSLMSEKAGSQRAKISKLESSIKSLTKQRDDAKSETIKSQTIDGASKAESYRLKEEKAEAVAKSTELENTVNELQGQIERLSADLNASKTLSNELKAQLEAASAKCNSSESRLEECLRELERISNRKESFSSLPSDIEANYKNTIHDLKESINQQNEEMQALNEAASASDSQIFDLLAQVSSLTTARDESKAKVEEYVKEISYLQSTVEKSKAKIEEYAEQISQLQSTLDDRIKEHDTTEVAPKEQRPVVTHSDEALSAINSEKEVLMVRIEECINRLDSECDQTQSMINEVQTKVSRMQYSSNGNKSNGIHSSQLAMDEVLSQAETLEKNLTEQDIEVSTLLGDAENLEARTRMALKKVKERYLVTTKNSKANLKQLHKKIQGLKADVTNSKVDLKKGNWSLPPQDYKEPKSSTSLLTGKTSDLSGEEIDGPVDDALQDDEDESNVQLFAFDRLEEFNWGRSKRKLKSIARFESMSFDKKAAHCKIGEGFLCPSCSNICSYDSKECDECHLKCYYEAGIGVVVLKERHVDTEQKSLFYINEQYTSQKNGKQCKSVLCHCRDCGKRNLKMQGLVSHYAKEHGGKPPWQSIMYSCPFCPSMARNPKSLDEVEAHVNASHSGRRLLKPNISKKAPNRRHKIDLMGDRTIEDVRGVPKEQNPPSWAWSKIEHVQLLPDGGKEYPRELSRVIDFIEAQCNKQEENVLVAKGECQNEAELEAKALKVERLFYKRGLRERTGMADQERLEKLRFSEKADEMIMRYEREGRDKMRPKEDTEAIELCSRPIVFSAKIDIRFAENSHACMAEECQFCKRDSIYRQDLLLDNELDGWDVSANESPLMKKTAKILHPVVRLIDDDSFLDADDDAMPGVPSATKRLKLEEDKLGRLKSTKHKLEFINKYNNGMLTNAWGGRRKDDLKRKSSSL
eukprot:CAMPEP_0183744074 /NCGR_PEP_ID=MMETSP0737-20130205/65543_1 /TAXON_ID=385413 /ORGANISM="Thalassiosira miniscula, Strain CCMP1093" /LENGTH=1854 /DNA_ID=CAMNT_0025979709 /DNA_START=85 /DNA_END=5650 /DNA_ORIENTATION=+